MSTHRLCRMTASTGIYLVLEDSGPAPLSATDEGVTYISLIDDLLTGQYDQVLRVMAFNPIEGWSRDVSEDVSRELERSITNGAHGFNKDLADFVEAILGARAGVQLAML